MTRYCPITYDALESSALYSAKGLKLLSPKLETLAPLPYSAQEQRNEAVARASKLSIQGVQPKLSAILDLDLHTFVFIDNGGDYILKPDSNLWPELPANEAISMSLAERFNIEVPVHGLVFTKDDGLTYFIKRYDRFKAGFRGSRESISRDNDAREAHFHENYIREASSREASLCDRDSYNGNVFYEGSIYAEAYWPTIKDEAADLDVINNLRSKKNVRNKKVAVEDFAQLSSSDRETKYDSSIEKVIKIVSDFATFPHIERQILFRRILFNFVIGNEDMHLKNYSLIDSNGTWKLAPAYDFVNTTIAMKYPSEESALPINGRKNKLRREDFIDYLAVTRLNLTTKIINVIMAELDALKPTFVDLIGRSYLTTPMKEAYVDLMNERYSRLF